MGDKNGVNPQTSETKVKILRTESHYSSANIMWEGGEDQRGIEFKHCTWFIYPRNGSSVTKISFNYFDIYSEGNQCGDVLEINNVKFCGNEQNIEMVQYFTGYPLKVQFKVYGKNDRVGNRHRGFELEWEDCDFDTCPDAYDYSYEMEEEA